ncbi:MAG: ParB N-terminal domain-containing protein [Candidatus Pacearchaeota archaeon]
MKILCSYTKLVPVKDLVPHPDNENRHSEEQVRVLAGLIERDGYRFPIVVSNLSGMIASGHGRHLALQLLGEEFAPVDFQDFEDPIQELRVRTADNQIARYAEFQSHQFKLNLEKYDIDISEIKPEEFGMLNCEFLELPKFDLDDDSDKIEDEENRKFIVEVQLPNEMEMQDIYDDMISRGYVARIKK